MDPRNLKQAVLVYNQLVSLLGDDGALPGVLSGPLSLERVQQAKISIKKCIARGLFTNFAHKEKSDSQHIQAKQTNHQDVNKYKISDGLAQIHPSSLLQGRPE